MTISNRHRYRDRDRNRKAAGLERDKPDGYRLATGRSAGYAIEKIDFDTDSDPDPDGTTFRQAMCQTLILGTDDACLAAACP